MLFNNCGTAKLQTGIVIAEDADDDKVVAQLARLKPAVLLCAFHAVKRKTGGVTNGLALLQHLEQDLPCYDDVPVLMPISESAAAVF